MEQTTVFQRLEGAALFVAGLYFYLREEYAVLWFLVLLFAFDVSMAGYLVNNTLGARLYNIGHSVLLPVALLLVGTWNNTHAFTAFALIWIAHIGMDRALGYGLKHDTGFRDTHLGRIGKA